MSEEETKEPQAAASVDVTPEQVEEGKICAILCYVTGVGIIWYFVDEKQKSNPYVKFHCKQGLMLLIANLILGTVTCGLFSILGLILWVIGLLNVLNGETKPLPVIGEYAEKFFKF